MLAVKSIKHISSSQPTKKGRKEERLDEHVTPNLISKNYFFDEDK